MAVLKLYKLIETFAAEAVVSTEFAPLEADLKFNLSFFSGEMFGIDDALVECETNIQKQVKAFLSEHNCTVLEITKQQAELKHTSNSGGVDVPAVVLSVSIEASFLPKEEKPAKTGKNIHTPKRPSTLARAKLAHNYKPR